MCVYVLVHVCNCEYETYTNVVGVFKNKEKALKSFRQKRKSILDEYKKEKYEEDYRDTDYKKGYFHIEAVEGWDSLEIEKKELEV